MPAVMKPEQPTVQTPAVIAAKYGDSQHFCKIVNPSAQVSFARQPERACGGNYPTLAEISQTYGRNFAEEWLIPQIYDLSVFTGAKKGLSEMQQEMLVRMIASEYPQLKVTEILLFFYRFKTGRYGRFYGSVDPMVVMEALGTFLQERDDLRRRYLDKTATQWCEWAREVLKDGTGVIREKFGLMPVQLYIGEVDGYKRKVYLDTDSREVFNLLTTEEALQYISDVIRQTVDNETEVVIWHNSGGGVAVRVV